MKRFSITPILFAALLSITAPLPALAQSGATAPPPARDSIEAASRAFDDAQFRHDRTAIDGMLAADFRIVHGSGRVGDREDFMKGFTDPAVVFEPFVILDRVVTPLGPDAAVVSGDGTIRGTENGKPFSDRFRFADIFRRRDGRWEVAFVQVTPLPAK